MKPYCWDCDADLTDDEVAAKKAALSQITEVWQVHNLDTRCNACKARSPKPHFPSPMLTFGAVLASRTPN